MIELMGYRLGWEGGNLPAPELGYGPGVCLKGAIPHLRRVRRREQHHFRHILARPRPRKRSYWHGRTDGRTNLIFRLKLGSGTNSRSRSSAPCVPAKADGAIMGDAFSGGHGGNGVDRKDPVPEVRGSDLGYLTFGLVLEALGKPDGLAAPGFRPRGRQGLRPLAAAQQAAVLPGVVDGSIILSSRWTKGRGMTRPKRRARRLLRKAMASC